MVATPQQTNRAKKRVASRTVSFVTIIFAIAVVLGAAYLVIGKPGEPDGRNITAPSGDSNQPVR